MGESIRQIWVNIDTQFRYQNMITCTKNNMSMCVRKPTIWVPTRPDTNRDIQSQMMVRGWKFWIQKVEELYYRCSENEGADQLRSICAFVFAYADCWSSHAVAHIKMILLSPDGYQEYKYSSRTLLQTYDFLQFDLSRALHFSARVFR